MRSVLLINSTPSLNNSKSRELTNHFITAWLSKYPEDKVIERDIGKNPIPHLRDSSIEAINMPQSENIKDNLTRKLSIELIAELKTADVIVIGVPMHNYSIPSTLKAYFDHIAIEGETWHADYGKNKSVLVITTMGGNYLNSSLNFVTPYIKAYLAEIDLTNITFIAAQGLCKSEEICKAAIVKAKEEIQQFIDNFMIKDQLSFDKQNNKESAITESNARSPLIKNSLFCTPSVVQYDHRQIAQQTANNNIITDTPLASRILAL